MKKIVRQQNYLKELIESQGNKFLSKQALKCLVRSALEPLLDEPESGVVLYRIDNRVGLEGLIRRLEFSEIESYSYSDNSENLLEKVWANTEFIFVMTHRFVSIIIWDNNTGDNNTVRYYSLYNSKLQSEPLDIVKRNSKVDITPYIEKYNPDRRDNVLLNSSIRRLLDNIDDLTSDAVLGYAEKSAETLSTVDYASKKHRVIAHEIRNQLSICDLYSEIIDKQVKKNYFDGVQNSLSAIKRAIKMANNFLITLRSKDEAEIKEYSVKEIVENAKELSMVYCENKNIEFTSEYEEDFLVLADYDKLTAVIINLVKNATEAFCDEKTEGNYIKIRVEKDGENALIMVSNNAQGIKEPEKIFDEGYTTKVTGSGLGLWICKKSMEEQEGALELTRSTDDYTEFTIKIKSA